MKEYSYSPTQIILLNALRAVVNGEKVSLADESAIGEARHQAVLSLVCTNLDSIASIANNVQLMWEQQQLDNVLKGIPYMVIKGSCAALYYPEPIRRTLGDIDLLVRPQYFDDAVKALVKMGYKTTDALDDDDRHIHFHRNGITIELHRRFATLQTKRQEDLLDGWIYSAELVKGGFGKYTFPMLPDQLNGLVLLTHINQHLEEGLGLRHMVDWVMYVKHSLPDTSWPSFKEKTDQLGLTKLAKAGAKLGQMYMGLDASITWCNDVDEDMVNRLLNYMFECGNFGHKDPTNNTIVMVMSHGRGVKGFFGNLQQRGVANWSKVQEYPWLKMVAWVYQLCRYVRIGMKKDGIKNFRKNVEASRRRNRLLDELEATRRALRETKE